MVLELGSPAYTFLTSHLPLQIDVSVNAPESGTIKEFLVSEEDTVTVGQELVKLELGGAPEGKKDAAPEQPKESAPAPEKPKESEVSKPAPPSEKPKETPKKAESPKPQGAADSKPAFGNREERRVCQCNLKPRRF